MVPTHGVPGQQIVSLPGHAATGGSIHSEFAPQRLAAHTASGHEKCGHRNVRVIERSLPLDRTQHKWNDGSRVTFDLSLFPSCIFERISRNEPARVLDVAGAPEIASGTGGQPSTLARAGIVAPIDLIQRSIGEVDRSELETSNSKIPNCHSFCAQRGKTGVGITQSRGIEVGATGRAGPLTDRSSFVG